MDRVDELAKIIWDYNKLDQRLEKADLIAVFGSYGVLQAEYGVELFKKGYAPLILFSGGVNELGKPEAEEYKQIALGEGIPEDKILVEGKATNTGKNVIYTRELLKEKGLEAGKIIAVHEPYMERRTYTTFRKQWADAEVVVTSPPISYEEYCKNLPKEGIDKEFFINVMVGDMQRVKVYAEKGYAIHQDIPEDVWNAYLKLVSLGYNKRLAR